MTSSLLSQTIQVVGPFWQAKVDLVELQAPGATVARTLLPVQHFADYAEEQDPLHWKDTEDNNDYDEDPRLFKVLTVDGNRVFGTRSVQNQIHSHYVAPGALTWSNYTLRGRLRFTHKNSGIGITFYSQFPQRKRRYYMVRRLADHAEFQLVACDDQAEHLEGELTAKLATQLNTWYRFHIEVSNTTHPKHAGGVVLIRAKLWPEEAAEPTAYQITATDHEEERPTFGTIGVWTRGPGAKYIDELEVIGTPRLPDEVALRMLFVANQPRAALGQDKLLLPGTLMALVSPRQVVIKPEDKEKLVYRWQRPNKSTAGALAIDEIQKLLSTGELSLLLLEVDPARWPADRPDHDDDDDDDDLPRFTCLAGELVLDRLQPNADSDTRLYRDLTLAPVAMGLRPGAAGLRGVMSVHSSGLTILGKMHLPWQATEQAVTAPFQLARLLPDPTAGAKQPGRAFQLTIEEEHLTDDERNALITTWRRLSGYINPPHPLNELSVQGAASAAWATLEIVNPRALPRLFWQMTEWQAAPARLPLFFAPGEMNLLLSDQSPYAQVNPPLTLATIAPTELRIERLPTGALEIRLTAGNATNASSTQIIYQASPVSAQESFQFPATTLFYDPLETPRLLREQLDLPIPEWVAGAAAQPLAEPLLWGYAPLDDGWVQLPVPNLTEQIYLDALAEPITPPGMPPATEPTPAMRGVFALGNSRRELLDAARHEQPWRVTLTAVGQLSGSWLLEARADGYAVTAVTLALTAPRLQLDGFLWWSTAKPTAADALPDAENWIAALRAPSLRMIETEQAAFPPGIRLEMAPFVVERKAQPNAALVAPQLGPWHFRYQTDTPGFSKLVQANVLPANAYDHWPPLLWRRIAAIPMIQALPLTQSQLPPSHPSASRQLAPYELAGRAWRFGVQAVNGAAHWPGILDPHRPARAWAASEDLPMVALSLPGLAFSPNTQFGDTGLMADATHGAAGQLFAHLRFDLPYTDEHNALAQLPKAPRDPQEVSPFPTLPPPPPPRPLLRETVADHWRQLAERASLATVAAAQALSQRNGQLLVNHLIEPLAWAVKVTLDLDAYPGMISIENASAPENAPLVLHKERALQGFAGRFAEGSNATLVRLGEQAANTDATYTVRAGSMATALVNGALRDQRGLARGYSQPVAATPPFVVTPLTLHGTGLTTPPDPQQTRTVQLTSLLEAVALQTPQGQAWHFWFRDLPVAETQFKRSAVLSTAHADVNDPEAISRDHNYLLGYEWRLGHSQNPADTLQLNGLDFYPLTLESVIFADNAIVQIEVDGRLQLPLPGRAEVKELGNVVRLRFTRTQVGSLALTDLTLQSSIGEWPLQLEEGELLDTVRLLWKSIQIEADGHLVIGGDPEQPDDGVKVRFTLFDTLWSVPVGKLRLAPMAVDLPFSLPLATGQPTSPLQAQTLKLLLNLTPALEAGRHTAALLLGAHLGNPAAPFLTMTIEYNLLHPQASGTLAADAVQLLGKLQADMASSAQWRADHHSVQVTWARCSALAERALSGVMQFLPGMPILLDQTSGFVALTFQALASPAPLGRELHDPATDLLPQIPGLTLTSCFVEALFVCDWGQYMQTPTTTNPESWPQVRAYSQAFASSAGDLLFGYTLQWQAAHATWDEALLVSGFLEVQSLISWPLASQYRADVALLRLPPPAEDPTLGHLRHTLRTLFNQHPVPLESLLPAGASVLFTLRADSSWQFLAVVEHQLLDVRLAADQPTTHVLCQHDRRWTALQEVRILSAPAYRRFLQGAAVAVIDPVLGSAPRGTLYGHFQQNWVEALTNANSPDAITHLDNHTLLVEASAPHWIASTPLEEVNVRRQDAEPALLQRTLPATTLQYLPQGAQLAILSTPDDFAPTHPTAPGWQLLALPFLGRLQDAQNDGLTDSSQTPPRHPFQIDPLLRLARWQQSAAGAPPTPLTFLLSSWSETTAVEWLTAPFDHTALHTWSQLDALSLEENWFRLQHPLTEPLPARLPSVIAALPDTPARLSRAVALRTAFNTFRSAYPPALPSLAALPTPQPPLTLTQPEPVWRRDRLLVWQGGSQPLPSDGRAYPWSIAALHLLTSRFWAPNVSDGAPRHFAAATLLPALLTVEKAANPIPVSLAVSPYVGLEFLPAPTSALVTKLELVELLTLDAATQSLRPLTSQFFEVKPAATLAPAALRAWGKETHLRVNPQSPLALLRRRRIEQPDNLARATASAPLVTTYAFLLADQAVPDPLTQRTFRLRTQVDQLRAREGQFGGRQMPRALRAFEVAPPQTVRVQPVYLTPDALAGQAPAWPWGVSALRVKSVVTAGQVGIAGRALPTTLSDEKARMTLWWQAPNHRLQFRSRFEALGAVAGLPPLFRAEAVPSLLPVAPALTMPDVAAITESGDSEEGAPFRLQEWQAILPGATQYLLTGMRAGALIALRNQLLRQSDLDEGSAGALVVSGSIPVQHRAPRPVPLPANRTDALNPSQDAHDKERALQPWASYFEPTRSEVASPAPVDEAFFAACGETPAQRLRLTLVTPLRGEVDEQWDGKVTFGFTIDSGADLDAQIQGWQLTLEIANAGVALVYQPPTEAAGAPPAATPLLTFALQDDAQSTAASTLGAWVRQKGAGAPLTLLMHVTPPQARGGFRQTLTFTLRIADRRGLPLPLEPRFLYFEDPEYNRRLASLAGRAEAQLQVTRTVTGKEATRVHRVALTSDRRQYNPDSPITLRYDWDDPETASSFRAAFTFQRISKDGVAIDLTALVPDLTAVPQANVLQFSLSSLKRAFRAKPSEPLQYLAAEFASGELLRITLTLAPVDPTNGAIKLAGAKIIVLPVAIVAEPVIPAPEAAYALLRRQVVDQQVIVDCARFAWAPAASRIDLVCADDLLQEVVRRRAVFKWQDSLRPAAATGEQAHYRIQKIAQNGATHFPEFG